MQESLRVNSAALHVMATRWGASAGELNASAAPAVLGLACQASTAAVNAAHTEVTAFTASLSAQVRTRAAHVAEANNRYKAKEAGSAKELAGVVHPEIRV